SRSVRQTPVIMSTARDGVEDRIRGSHDGADDYSVKPFSFSESSARSQASTRRGRAQEPVQSRIGDSQIDSISRKAWRAGVRSDSTAKEFNSSASSSRRQGQVSSRTTSAEQVWDMNFDSDTSVIDVAVRRSGSKSDDPFEAKSSHTVRGMGYVLESRPEPARE
ncbi:hypothetical protein OY671_010914, partial [Metschnikowia pulcherrima]